MPSFSEEERRLLNDSILGFLTETYSFEHWQRRAADQAHSTESEVWRQYADLGWLGVAIDEQFGGSGGGMTELGIVMAAAGRHMVLEALLETMILGVGAIEMVGTKAQKAELLPKIVAGELRFAFCHTEPDAGYARNYVRSVAHSTPDGYILNGQKAFALGVHTADLMIVSARIDGDDGPVGLFLISPTKAGVSLTMAPSLDTRNGATIQLSLVHVPAAALLSESTDDRLDVIDRLIDRGAIAVCAEACGAMAAATDDTVGYLKVRQQFGQPLSKFQVLQHRLVDMSLACEEARAIVHVALDALDAGSPDAQRAVWHAKVQTSQSARFVGTQCLQLHGGIGMTDELKAGHLFKRLSVCEALFGDADWYLKSLAASPHEPIRSNLGSRQPIGTSAPPPPREQIPRIALA